MADNLNKIPLEPVDIKIPPIGSIASASTINLIQENFIYSPSMSIHTSGGVSYLLASSSSLFAINPGYLLDVKQRFTLP